MTFTTSFTYSTSINPVHSLLDSKSVRAYTHDFEPIDDLSDLPKKWFTVAKVAKCALALLYSLGMAFATLGAYDTVVSGPDLSHLLIAPLLLFSWVNLKLLFKVKDYSDPREVGVYRRSMRDLPLSEILKRHSATNIHTYKLLPPIELASMHLLLEEEARAKREIVTEKARIDQEYNEAIAPELFIRDQELRRVILLKFLWVITFTKVQYAEKQNEAEINFRINTEAARIKQVNQYRALQKKYKLKTSAETIDIIFALVRQENPL